MAQLCLFWFWGGAVGGAVGGCCGGEAGLLDGLWVGLLRGCCAGAGSAWVEGCRVGGCRRGCRWRSRHTRPPPPHLIPPPSSPAPTNPLTTSTVGQQAQAVAGGGAQEGGGAGRGRPPEAGARGEGGRGAARAGAHQGRRVAAPALSGEGRGWGSCCAAASGRRCPVLPADSARSRRRRAFSQRPSAALSLTRSAAQARSWRRRSGWRTRARCGATWRRGSGRRRVSPPHVLYRLCAGGSCGALAQQALFLLSAAAAAGCRLNLLRTPCHPASKPHLTSPNTHQHNNKTRPTAQAEEARARERIRSKMEEDKRERRRKLGLPEEPTEAEKARALRRAAVGVVCEGACEIVVCGSPAPPPHTHPAHPPTHPTRRHTRRPATRSARRPPPPRRRRPSAPTWSPSPSRRAARRGRSANDHAAPLVARVVLSAAHLFPRLFLPPPP